MPLIAGERLQLSIDKPAAGGRMIARHDGQVVLVQGAIPGEQVIARVDRAERQVVFADTVEVLVASPDRVTPNVELSCGGCLYAHIASPRQRQLKAEVLQDAFTRLGRLPLSSLPSIAASGDRGYRMRARLHVRGAQAGFYREGTHDLCDAAPTQQLSDAALESALRSVRSLVAAGCPVTSVELSENIAGDERVLHLTAGADAGDAALDAAREAGELTGCTLEAAGTVRTSGVPVVADPLSLLTAGRAAAGSLERHAVSFFQANRFLLPQLVVTVLDRIPGDGEVLDLYAGVGLFCVALAGAGRTSITAVEGDRSSGRDLLRNAAFWSAGLRVRLGSVEDYLRRRKGAPAATIVVDPPRTGISREAMQAVVAHGAGRIVYVSCDPATMARDARRLVDGGYRLTALEGFDLFPNTPHVETVVKLVRGVRLQAD